MAVSLAHPRKAAPDAPPVQDADILWPESSSAFEAAQRIRAWRELDRPRVPQVAYGRYTHEVDRDPRATHRLLAHLMHPVGRR